MSNGFLLPSWLLSSCFPSTFLRQPWSIQNSITLDGTVILCLPTKPSVTVGGLNGLFGAHFDSCRGLLMQGGLSCSAEMLRVHENYCMIPLPLMPWLWSTIVPCTKLILKIIFLMFPWENGTYYWCCGSTFSLSQHVVYFPQWLYSLHRWLI